MCKKKKKKHLAVVVALRRGGEAVFWGDLDLVGHDAPAIQHLGAGSLQLLQDLRQLSVVVARRAPAQHPSQVVAGAQGQHPQLALRGECNSILCHSVQIIPVQ